MELLEQQHKLTRHIRDPERASAPDGVEPRRIKIYTELFYNNIEDFVSSSFPILRELTDDICWHEMVRDFMESHRCQSPYFLEISQEFLLYLQNTRESRPDDYPFMLELAHYEWVELALDCADTDLNEIEFDRNADLMESLPVVSPLAWSLAYEYPVHQIGPDFIPEQAGQPAYLVVYRTREDRVEFMEANAVTARLLELLQTEGISSGRDALIQLADEMNHPQPEQLLGFGEELLGKLWSLDIILGA